MTGARKKNRQLSKATIAKLSVKAHASGRRLEDADARVLPNCHASSFRFAFAGGSGMLVLKSCPNALDVRFRVRDMITFRPGRGLWVPLLATLAVLRDVGAPPSPGMAFRNRMPGTVVWAWQEPEDLSSADPAKVGVAYLAKTLLLGANGRMTALPRHQPLAIPPGMAVMAVVRIESRPGFKDSGELREQTAAMLVHVAEQPGVRALQVDFDAARSEHAFYAGVLRALRPRMPAGMPLSITALASWCSGRTGEAGWLAGLPVDEAVPMLFRLGAGVRPFDDKSWIPVTLPVCRSSVGVATDESWPKIGRDQRVYVFARGPWRPAQLEALADLHGEQRPAALRQENGRAAGVSTPVGEGRLSDVAAGEEIER